jgi:hypothetical protein
VQKQDSTPYVGAKLSPGSLVAETSVLYKIFSQVDLINESLTLSDLKKPNVLKIA